MVEALIDPCASFEYSSVKKESTFCNNLMQKSNLLHFYFKVLLYTVIALTQHRAYTRFRAKKNTLSVFEGRSQQNSLEANVAEKIQVRNDCTILKLYEIFCDKVRVTVGV